ncbi:MAG: ComF family protein [Candidatus Nealsonbacteria bacterium]
MKIILSKIKENILDILFPKFCLNCGKEKDYLCQDCFSLIDILERQYCPFCHSQNIVVDGKTCNFCKRTKTLNGLYCAVSYSDNIIKKLINQFKYQPYIKELSKLLSHLILIHFIKLNKSLDFKEFIIIPIPLHKKKIKQRGFNQANEIGKELSKSLKIPIYNDILIKIKETPPQMELKKDQRKENIKQVFSCQNQEKITNKKILLIDDVFTTGSTMEECAFVLKQSKAKQIWGVAIARGQN